MSDPNKEDAALAETLAALASPVRIAILRQLRAPRVLSDIRVTSEEPRGPGVPSRPLSRQAVRQHIDRLLEVGVVGRVAASESSPFTVDHRRIFSAAEDLRALAALRPLDDPLLQATATMEGSDLARSPPGPRLALVRGLGEGTTYPLDEGDEWVIGRRRDVDVPLDYDPFVSGENARVRRGGAGFLVEDLPGSRNGTTLNFRRMDAGATARLRHGDIIGVGHSSLVFWAD